MIHGCWFAGSKRVFIEGCPYMVSDTSDMGDCWVCQSSRVNKV